MNDLTKIVTIISNDKNSVILKVKKNKRMDLIKTGFFDGDEDMFRVTKGKDWNSELTYTCFKNDGSHFSWDSRTLVCNSLEQKQYMIYETIHDDFGIILQGDCNGVTNNIKTINDDKKSNHCFKAMWFNEDSIQLHKDGTWFKSFNNLNEVKEFISSRYNIIKEEDSRSPNTNCFIKTFQTK